MTSTSSHPLRSVIVVGGGIVGLSAAIAFARALPRARISLVELPVDRAALADRMPATLPSIHRFHQRIGIEEDELIRAGAATHILATRFDAWGKDWYAVHGEFGLPEIAAPFHWVWLKGLESRNALPFHLYSASAAMAAAGKFVHPDPTPGSPLHAFDYGLRLEPLRYRALLSTHADRHRIVRIKGECEGAERRPEGGIAAIRLKDGRRLEADLFIDASGPSAPLLSLLSDAFEDWSGSLPCDRILIVPEPGVAPSPTDVATAMPWGWRGNSPSPFGGISTFAYASTITADKEVRTAAGRHAELIVLNPGRRPQPWIDNVLAIGDAAVVVDPLHASQLHLAHDAITRALDLLPGRDFHPLALREYARLTEMETRRVRDFLALHFLASQRRFGPFWKAMAKREKPDSLAHSLDLWLRRSQLPFYEEESFTRENWLGALLGMGIEPRQIDSRAAALDPTQCATVLDQTARAITSIPAQLPAYPDYLRRMMGR